MARLFVFLLDIIAVILSVMVGQNIKLRRKPHYRLTPPTPTRRPVRPAPSQKPASRFKLGARSKKELIGVHPKLVEVVKRAIEITDMDFTVYDGKRSAAEQNRHYKNGASQLDGYKKRSYHQSGNAVDLVPAINGMENHKDWDNYYIMAVAVVKAAKELNVAHKIRWGAVWDRRLSALKESPSELRRAVRAYCKRHPGADFLDGPHFEWRD